MQLFVTNYQCWSVVTTLFWRFLQVQIFTRTILNTILMSFEHLAVMYTDFESVDVHTSRNKHLNIEFSVHGAFL